MELQVGAKVLLKNTEGKYLIIRRSPYEERGVGKWDIPGGRIDAGSPLLDNLKREVSEETGLELTDKPRLVAAQDLMWPDRHVVRLTYIGMAEGTPILSVEHDAFQWVTFVEMEDLENLDTFIKELIDDGTISETTHG